MSCSVALSKSPVFSPSLSLFCNKTSIVSSSSAPASPSASSPSSPFRFRLQKPPTARSSSSPSLLSPSSSSSNSVSAKSGTKLLKRKKQPARLVIPAASLRLVAPVWTPSDGIKEVEIEEDGYSLYCKRGRRENMEDRYSAALNLQGDPKQAFFGVFDGHGGAKAAEFAAGNLQNNILGEVAKREEDEIEEAIKHGYLITDGQFLEEDMRGGACCVTALIRNGNLIVSNAGDCRAVMSRGGVAEALTSDHRPSREDERDRIDNKGGFITFCHGCWRIDGCLAVSRGIGDRDLKEWVIAEPESKIISLKSEHEFLILASDGLWDMVSNQEAIDIARPLCVETEKPAPLLACKKLADLSVSRGSCDDISVMLISLARYC